MFNFQEKTLRNSTHPILASGDVVKIEYYPYWPIRVQVKDSASIATLKALGFGDGIVDGPVISDTSILTFEDARRRAKAEIDAYANPIINAKFTTNKGGLHA